MSINRIGVPVMFGDSYGSQEETNDHENGIDKYPMGLSAQGENSLQAHLPQDGLRFIH